MRIIVAPQPDATTVSCSGYALSGSFSSAGHIPIVGLFVPALRRDLPSLGDVQGGQVALDDAAVETIVDKVGEAAEEALAGVVV